MSIQQSSHCCDSDVDILESNKSLGVRANTDKVSETYPLSSTHIGNARMV